MKQLRATLLEGPAMAHREANRRYLLSLENDRMFANFYIQAGLNSNRHTPPKTYGGWELPDTQVHGNISGHYLSACAMAAHFSGDMELLGRVIKAVDILEECQQEGEDGYLGAIPSVYLDRIARKKWVWAPHYNIHKTIMGLADAYKYCKIEKALEILSRMADWFLNWTAKFSYERMQDILDYETGGVMEVWADLYGLTGDTRYKTLMERYAHFRFFDPILEGKDVLTNTHANTTIPEAHGMARAYQVTGEEKYRKLAQGYLDLALFHRDALATGGQTTGEVWVKDLSHADLGSQTQEHCTVYNMIRLCEYVMTWDDDVRYADYIEQNITNGLMAQHRLSDGMNTYYLPTGTGGKKDWSTPCDTMTCCLGTTMQANASWESRIFFEKDGGLAVAQYLPAKLTWEKNGNAVQAELTTRYDDENFQRPEKPVQVLHITCPQPTEFTLTLRIPSWSAGTRILVNGREVLAEAAGVCRWFEIPGLWQNDTVELFCTESLRVCPLGDTDYQAFLYGPAVLAGLTEQDGVLRGVTADDLAPRARHDWGFGSNTWEARSPHGTVALKPLRDVDEERYTVYFEK